jgi:hypothetical protein
MSDEERAAVIARFEDMPPHHRLWLAQVMLGMALLLESSVVELAVPVGRALARKRGIQTGPALGSLLTFLAFQAWTTVIAREVTRDDDSPDDDGEGRRDRWLERILFSGAEYLPAVGAVLPGTVVLRNRSPLWGLALWPLVRVIGVFVLVGEAARLKRSHAGDEQEPGRGTR